MKAKLVKDKRCLSIVNRKLYIILLFAAMLAGCAKDNEPEKTNGPGKSEASFNATFTPQTVYFNESETSKDLVSISDDGTILTFSNSSDKAKKLKKGDVILIHGKVLRKADKITQGNTIVVETVDASLNEAIQEGTINWTTYCDFQPGMQMQAEIGGNIYYPSLRSDKEISFNFKFGDFDYSIVMNLDKDSAQVKLEVSKKIAGGIKGKFTAEGKISSLYSENKIEYEKAQLKNYSNSNNNVSGELTLALTVAGSGSDALDLELPVILFAYPLMVGPIPTVIKIKLQVVINSVVPLDGSAQVSTKFKYDSQTGISCDGVKTETKGKIGNYSMDKQGTEVGASSSIGVNYGIGFPRIEIGVFGNAIVPYIQTAFLIGGSYTSFPACRQIKASFIGGCGVDFSFLGFKHKEKKNLWQQDKVLLQIGDCK